MEETREAVGLGGDQLKLSAMIDQCEPSVCKYEKLKDEEGKLLSFAEDSKMSAFKSLLPLELETI